MEYEFTVLLDRAPSEDEYDVLFEAGLDDTQPVVAPDGRAWLMVARDAASLWDAIVSVVADAHRAGFQAAGVKAEDLVTPADIAERVGKTREYVRLLAAGKRGPGGFPPARGSDQWAFYSWAEVRAWWVRHFGDGSLARPDRDADTLVAADLMLRARLVAPEPSRLAELVSA